MKCHDFLHAEILVPLRCARQLWWRHISFGRSQGILSLFFLLKDSECLSFLDSKWPFVRNEQPYKNMETQWCHMRVIAPQIAGDSTTLQWRHNGHDSVSNHQPLDCLLDRLFRRRSKKTSKLRVTGLCAGNSPGTGEFPAQMASNAEMFPFDDVIMKGPVLRIGKCFRVFTNRIKRGGGSTLRRVGIKGWINDRFQGHPAGTLPHREPLRSRYSTCNINTILQGSLWALAQPMRLSLPFLASPSFSCLIV